MARLVLFVDDLREPPINHGVYYQIVRTLDDAKKLLRHVEYKEVSLDFSLGETGETTLDLLQFMYEQHLDFVKSFNIHTDNERRVELVRYIQKHFPNAKITHYQI